MVRNDGGYDLSLARLEAIEDSLQSGAHLDERVVDELLALIALLAHEHPDNAKPQRPRLFREAAVALLLQERYSLRQKAAILAVLPDALSGAAHIRRAEAVKKAMQRLKKSTGDIVVLDSWVERAAPRIGQAKGTGRKA